tara:strand:- start:975 stop:1178 length:204 start_codon:yes stop_codon:yes gene_type:complete
MSAKMYALVEDNIEKYYTLAEKVIGECEHIEELYSKMSEHKDLLNGSGENYEDGLGELWNEYWSKYY